MNDVHTLSTVSRTVTPQGEKPLAAPILRRNVTEQLYTHYDIPQSIDSGPGPATLDATPPRSLARSRPRYTHMLPRQSAIPERSPRLSSDQTIELFARKIGDARQETHQNVPDAAIMPDALKPKLTVDLGHQSIDKLPDAIVDLIIADVERLSLSYNHLRFIPARIVECKQLRYLNLKSNELKEIPAPLFNMPLLEILDVSKNKIAMISPEIKQLRSLRVFAMQHNKLQDLPSELGDMPQLKIMKVAGNPLKKSLLQVMKAKEAEVAYPEMLENEKDSSMTIELLRHLKMRNRANSIMPSMENGEPGDAISETARPARRVISGRFPIPIANPALEPMPEDADNVAQLVRPPLLPIRSHLRNTSGQSNGLKRSAISPLVGMSERNRSNSESVLQAAANRQKRMGILRSDRTELGSIDETRVVKPNHVRGYSYGSALRRNGSISSPVTSSSPSSPRDARKERAQFVRRLSSLPEHKTEHLKERPVFEGAKGILFALYQVHPQIQGLIGMHRPRNDRRSILEMAFYQASKHIDELNKSLEEADQISPDNATALDSIEATVQRDCASCIKSFAHVTAQLQDVTRKIVAEADPRYVRSFMLLLYGSIVEVRNAMKHFGLQVSRHCRQMSSGPLVPIQTIPEEPATPDTPSDTTAVPDSEMNGMTIRQHPARARTGTVVQYTAEGSLPRPEPNQQLTQLKIPQTVPAHSSQLYSAASSRASSISSRSFTPRSRSNSRTINSTIGSQPLSAAVPGTPTAANGPPHTQTPQVNMRLDLKSTAFAEEQKFEQIFMALTKAYQHALQAIPKAQQYFRTCLARKDKKLSKAQESTYTSLSDKCRLCLEHTEALQIRLMGMKLKANSQDFNSAAKSRHEPMFWLLCRTFLQSFVGVVTEMRQARDLHLLPHDIVAVLRPVQKSCREAGHLIETSPWNAVTMGPGLIMPAPTPLASGGVMPAHAKLSSNQVGVQKGQGMVYQQVTNSHRNEHNTPMLGLPPLQPPPPISALPTPISAPNSATSGPGPSPLSVQLPATPLTASLGFAAAAALPQASPSTPLSLYGDTTTSKSDVSRVFQRAESLLNMPQAVGGVNFLGRRN